MLSAVCLVVIGCASSRVMVVGTAPVIDLRARPHTLAEPGAHDPLEETQLLYGERVRVLKEERGWAHVEAMEQPEFTHGARWQGYPGWVPLATLLPGTQVWPPTVVVAEKWAQAFEDAYTRVPSAWRFPLGARLRATDVGGELWKAELADGSIVWLRHQSVLALADLEALAPEEKRRLIVHHAGLFLGDPYYWGGRSPREDGSGFGVRGSGVDCSGLVNLAYRAAGIEIPRDAHEQFLRARPIKALQPADLIFLSERANPKRIVHVMLYAGNGDAIEGPGTGQTVRRIAVAARLGQPLDALATGAVVDGQTVSFGSYLP